jgi:hypothetical protein
MAPPPGYAAYSGPEFRGGGLRRVKGLATAIAILAGAACIGQLVSIGTIGAGRDAARDYLRTGDEDTFNEEFLSTSGGAVIVGLVSLALAVVTIIWLYRVTANHQALGRRLTWSPGWAIGGWFLPPCLFVIPFLMVREAFKASDPAAPPGTDSWRGQREHPLPWIWIVSFGVVPIVLAIANGFNYFSGFGGDTEDVADRILDTDTWVSVAQGVGGLVGAVAWGALVWTLTQRHTRLTGEANVR